MVRFILKNYPRISLISPKRKELKGFSTTSASEYGLPDKFIDSYLLLIFAC